jgi:hypothetical protein
MDMDEEMTTMHMCMHTDMTTATDMDMGMNMDVDIGGIEMDVDDEIMTMYYYV